MSSPNLNETKIILSQIESLERQARSFTRELRGLKARIASLSEPKEMPTHTLADLSGILQGITDTTEEEIDAVLYKEPPMEDWD